jgi:phage recombination protein Bet
MTNALTEAQAMPRSLQLADEELIPVLRSSLYPGATDQSIKLVIGYCKAAGLDPIQKPVHLVPMNVKKVGAKNEYEWRDVVMPGIGLYRIQASRTGELAGIDEPEFGPMKSAHGIEYPDYCKVTVYRMIGGQRVPFTACEFWEENYATAGRETQSPNAMWKRRPRGQIAKCAEAQALRKAFPELGSQPTADETIIDTDVVIEGQPAQTFAVAKKAAPAKPADVTDVQPKPEAPAPAAEGDLVGAGEIAYLKKKAEATGIDLDKLLADKGGLALDKLTKADFAAIKSELARG